MRQGFLTTFQGRATYDFLVYCNGYCGPAALGFCLREDPDEIGRRMGWQHHHNLGGIREDLQDSPPAHDEIIWSFGKQVLTRTCGDLKMNRATKNKTIVLLHPVSRHPFLAQHWVVYAGISPNGFVEVHWGDGTIKEIPNIDEWYSAGSPASAYEIVERGGRTKPNWFMRQYVKIMRWFA